MEGDDIWPSGIWRRLFRQRCCFVARQAAQLVAVLCDAPPAWPVRRRGGRSDLRALREGRSCRGSPMVGQPHTGSGLRASFHQALGGQRFKASDIGGGFVPNSAASRWREMRDLTGSSRGRILSTINLVGPDRLSSDRSCWLGLGSFSLPCLVECIMNQRWPESNLRFPYIRLQTSLA